MAKILVVEDEEDLASVVRDWLVRDNHTVEVVDDGEAALEDLMMHKFDLVVLDLMLPKLNGLEICRRYRAKGGDAHILMLTAQSSLDDREAGLDIGADDYLPKPFELRELVARVRALLRRPSARVPETVTLGELVIDIRQARVTKCGAEVKLVPKELDLLLFLVRHPGQHFTAEALLERVWSSSATPLPETVRTHVKTLRKKIDTPGKPSVITHVPGFGYKLEQ